MPIQTQRICSGKYKTERAIHLEGIFTLFCESEENHIGRRVHRKTLSSRCEYYSSVSQLERNKNPGRWIARFLLILFTLSLCHV
ncbi:MAG: hypothetical protein AYK19_07980 [Theionarchaea archaeon DG-70-1]|nr:MAG: hypothetical protein AYK19_07980 [Theionarchaea archaeon DG-70-1]